jgi:hypothetical protein
MAPYTKSHIEVIDSVNPVHSFYISMTPAAVYLPVQMHGMIEIDEVRNILDLYPKNRFILIVCSTEFFYFRMMDNDPSMTKHTGLQGRDSCTCCFYGAVVTEKTA